MTNTSIYSIIAHHRGEEWPPLPDDEHARTKNSSNWSYGAVDGMYSHHGGRPDPQTAERVFAGLRKHEHAPPAGFLAEGHEFYELLKEHQTLAWLESFEQGLAGSGLDPLKLYEAGSFLARNAGHREAVKAGMAMMSLVSGLWDREAFLVLGSHDEFTLFSVVAIRRKTQRDEGDALLLELAKTATGWGRIHAVERLDGSSDPLVRDWLLREGHTNDVMHEYTALICARTVNLATLLKSDGLDRDALSGAGDILASLLSGNEEAAAGMDAYEDGAVACELWLSRIGQSAANTGFLELEDFPRISLIYEKAKTEAENPGGMDQHWFSHAIPVRDAALRLLKNDAWHSLLEDAARSASIGARALASRIKDKLKSLD